MKTFPEFHQLCFSGGMLRRGFWLYVWEITTQTGDRWLYVGRTGDSSSLNAQSPFIRMGQHLGANVHSNALTRNLQRQRINKNHCQHFKLSCYGPIEEEPKDEKEFQKYRDKVAALEKRLQHALTEAGYNVLNTVACQKVLDEELWHRVQEAFAQEFPKLKSSSI